MRSSPLLLTIALLFLGLNAWSTRPIRVLSLDGGGIKGIVEIMILKDMEEALKKPISEIFDLVAGSSTGGLIALGLTLPNEDGKPRYRAEDILDIYLKNGSSIFNASFCHRFKTLGGLVGPKYETMGIMELSSLFLGDALLSAALIPTIITAYHLEGECGVEFYSEDARCHSDKDCLMRELAQATAAAPTYFPLAEVKFSWGTLGHLADGALYKPNPSMLAYAAAKRRFPDRDIEVYSLGSGKVKAHTACERLHSGGLLHWASPIVHHIQCGDCEADNDILYKLLNEDGDQKFFRLNPILDSQHQNMDDASKDNLRYLMQVGSDALKHPIYQKMLGKLQASES